MSADDLSSLLAELALEQHEEVLVEEELTLPLLRSMGSLLHENLVSLGLSSGDAERLARAVKRAPPPPPSAARGESSSPPAAACGECSDAAVPPFALRVRRLQEELFSEDLHPPPGAELWSVNALRAWFESGGEAVPPDCAAVGAARAPDDGPVVGALTIRYKSQDLSFEYRASTTVGALRKWLQQRTSILPAQQKLLGGWPRRAAPGAGSKYRAADAGITDETPLASIKLGAKPVMLLGTPQEEHAAAELELERARRTGRLVSNDLNAPLARPKPASPERSRSYGRSAGPILANHGGGIFLDPEVWAPPVAEARHEGGRNPHVLNPRTNRLERLEIGNALLADEPPGANAALDPDHRPEWSPINVDLIGTVRGRCTGCTRCPGYERRREPAASQNDTDALKCARCGCDSHQHEAI